MTNSTKYGTSIEKWAEWDGPTLPASTVPLPYIAEFTGTDCPGFVEIWRSEQEFLNETYDGCYGQLKQFITGDGEVYYRAPSAYYLSLMRSYMQGLKYRVVIQDDFVESYIKESNIIIDGNYPIFVPIVARKDLQVFAARCVRCRMFLA